MAGDTYSGDVVVYCYAVLKPVVCGNVTHCFNWPVAEQDDVSAVASSGGQAGPNYYWPPVPVSVNPHY